MTPGRSIAAASSGDGEGIIACAPAMSRTMEHRFEREKGVLTPMTSEAPERSNAASWCPIVELRQYALQAGRREDLIRLFDDEFLEPQERVGLVVMGQFRDLEDPNAFIWLRGFAGMEVRPTALSRFYDGPVWRANRDRANATMIDSDNVLLLRLARPSSGFSEVARPDGQTALGRDAGKGLLSATIYHLKRPAEGAFVDFFETQLVPVLRRAGAPVDAYYTTEPSPNNFPRLPVREREHVLVWFSRFPDPGAYQRYAMRFRHSEGLRAAPAQRLAGFLRSDPEIHGLLPTSRSRLQAPIATSLAPARA